MRTRTALSFVVLLCLFAMSCVVPHDYEPRLSTILSFEAASQRIEPEGVVVSDKFESSRADSSQVSPSEV